jgi:hypothetical protein
VIIAHHYFSSLFFFAFLSPLSSVDHYTIKTEFLSGEHQLVFFFVGWSSFRHYWVNTTAIFGTVIKHPMPFLQAHGARDR